MAQLSIRILREGAAVPSYAHPGDAGLDLCATEDVVLKPFERRLMPTGIAIAVPSGHAGLILPRSGNAIKRGLSIPNAPGLIDSGYRGELQVALINLDPIEPISISPGDRVAQLVIIPVAIVNPQVVTVLDSTDRGIDGFGSTGA